MNYTTPTATDNSGDVSVALTSGLAPGEVFPVGITTVTFEATDAAGNKAECSFTITVIDNENPTITCPSNRTETVAIGQTGKVVTYTLPVFNDNCSGSSIVQTTGLDSGSNFPLGITTNTFVVSDASGKTAECSFTVTITADSDTEVVHCKESIVLELDSNGEAFLNPRQLIIENITTLVYSVNKERFTCEDIGEHSVILSYENDNFQGSCDIRVIVKDNLPPEVQTRNINVTLNSFGIATITPGMIDNGSSDNCGPPQLSLDVSSFSCNDLGENEVILTATDPSGNTASLSAIVSVTGSCKEIPANPFEYISIYPNPTPGPFTFDTPNGWSIEKVEVFDTRGRYVLTETYSENQIEYSMDLSGLQESVYFLKLFTSMGIKILRVIIN